MKFKIKLEVLRCRITDKTDCDTMPDINVDVCSLGDNVLPLVNMLVKTPMKPPLQCPVFAKVMVVQFGRKNQLLNNLNFQGVHTAKNVTLDMRILAAIPMEGYHWKVKETFMFGPKQEDLYCNYFEGTVRLVKSNKKPK
jgi:hypothetical protein